MGPSDMLIILLLFVIKQPSVSVDSRSPTDNPTKEPTISPTDITVFPSITPTPSPTPRPTVYHGEPTRKPTPTPTIRPTNGPTPTPTIRPTPPIGQTRQPTVYPTVNPVTPRPTTEPSPKPTPSPTNYQVILIKPTSNPSVGPTDKTINPTYNPTIYTTYMTDDVDAQMNATLIFVLVSIGILDSILIVKCVMYIIKKLRLRTNTPGNASYITTIKQFGFVQYIGVIIEMFDMVTDYLFSTSLIIKHNNEFVILGWISLIFLVCGLMIFVFKYTTYRKLIAFQVKELKDKFSMCNDIDERDEIIKQIRYRSMDIDVISLLNGCIEDLPQTIIVLIATSNIKWNHISIITITISMMSFMLKLSKIMVTKLGCDDQSIKENKNEKHQIEEMIEIHHDTVNTTSEIKF